MIRKKLRVLPFVLVFLLLLSTIFSNSVSAAGKSYYVSLVGSDKNNGSFTSPWRSINNAIDKLRPGDTLFIMGGVYKEKLNIEVSGTEQSYITIASYPGQRAVLDGTGLKLSSSMDAMIYIYNQSNLMIDGIEARNFSTTQRGTCIAGILVDGNCKNVEICNNYIHEIKNLASVDSNRNGRDAHGIGVYGSSTIPFTGLKIEGNTISNCRLGSSEALAVNGNITDFSVINNCVHDNDNIGICFIGYEGTCSSSSQDRARNGICRDNLVYNIDSYENPAYGAERSADGIYCDGATNIIIERNIVHNANFGIELASEHKGKDTSYITVKDNIVYHNTNAGLAMGGYDTQRGHSLYNKILNNTFYHNDTLKGGFGEVYLQYTANYNVIENNIFYANSQNLLIYDSYATNHGNRVDDNVYYTNSGETSCNWRWKDRNYKGFTKYQEGTGNDMISTFANPMFMNKKKWGTRWLLPHLQLMYVEEE